MLKIFIIFITMFFVGCSGLELSDVKFKGPITGNDYEVGKLKTPKKEVPANEE